MPVPLYEQIYRYLFNEVKSGQLKRGDRVPSEKELAEQFHVSRITSKKALENLMQARIVERIRGKGTFVAQDLPTLELLAGEEELPVQTDFTSDNQLLIGIILEDFAPSYGLRLLQAIEDRCSELHLHLLIKRTHGQREEEEEAIGTFLQLGVDGLIVFPVHGDYYNPKLLKLVVDDFPLVLIDRYLKGIAAHCVYSDNRKAAFELATYLLEQGHTQIAFLSPPLENTSSIDDRLQGFRTALNARGIQVNEHYCYTALDSAISMSRYREHVQRDERDLGHFLAQNPQITAFFASEFNIALLLEHTLTAIDPVRATEVEIVCFDHPDQLFAPPLFTHILQDEAQMGHLAVDELHSRLQGQPIPLHTIIPHQLVIAPPTLKKSARIG